MSGFLPGKKKNLLFLSFAILLAMGAYIFYVSSFQTNKKLTYEQKTSLETAGLEACKKNMDKVNKIDADSLVNEENVEVLNYRGNCFMETGEYQKAIDQFEKMKAICNQMNNSNCSNSANEAIEIAKDIKNTVSQKQNKGLVQPGPKTQ